MSKSKAPTGLSISRNGSRFTFSWKKGDSDYDNGQHLQYRINGGGWVKPAIGKSATSYAVTNASVKTITFQVQGNRKKYKKGGKTVNPGWSAWASKTWTATVPQKPKVSYEMVSANSGTFEWSVDTSDTDTATFKRTEWQKCLSRSNANPPGSGWSASSNAGKNGSVTITEESEDISAGALVRWFRIRSVGPAKATDWVYYRHAYSTPASPILDAASAVNNGTFTRITAEWRGSYALLSPIDEITVQYAIDTPTDTVLSAPVSGWDDAITVSANGGNDKVITNIDEAIGPDECLWVRIASKHDEQVSYSNAICALVGTLQTPGFEATPDKSTGDALFVIEENTSCDAAGTVIFYRPESDPSADRIVAVLPRGTKRFTVNVPDVKSASKTCFGAYAFLGTYEGLSVNAVMRSGIVLDSDIVSVAPEWVTVSEWTHSDAVRIGWPWSWDGANQAELSWADHEDAWESTDEPESYIIENRQISSWVISELEEGKRWYFRVRLLYIGEDEEVTGPWSDAVSYNLCGIPDRPVLSLSRAVINEGDSITGRWGYAATDGTAQAYAEIRDEEGNILAHVEDGQSTELTPQWETGTTHYLSVRTTSTSGRQSEWSAPVSVYVAEPVSIEITSPDIRRYFEYTLWGITYEWNEPPGAWIPTSQTGVPSIVEYTPTSKETYEKALNGAEEIISETETRKSVKKWELTDSGLWTEPLRTMPITVTVQGAGVSGTTTVSIIRADDYHIYRPNETDYDGYAGETIATVTQTGDAPVAITKDNLIGSLDDGARYLLSCSVVDEYGQTAKREYPFTVNWSHKAGTPGAKVRIDKWMRIAVITPVAPENYVQGDTCDIYRLSADKPELIYQGAEFGVSYVDPFPAFGDFCGHRLVTRTSNGDYATADGTLAWFDAGVNEGDVLLERIMVIDVDGDQIELPYNIELSNSWNKDFERTAYLGGSVQGDWNPAITRDMSANTVILRGRDLDKQLSMRDLAGYVGVAHIRTPDGSSLTADIQVNETYSYQNKRVTYTLAIKAIDPQGLDGMTLSQWEEMHPR